MGSDGSSSQWTFIAHDGRLHYACLRPDERHYATSTQVLNNCLWHGSECDDWNLLIPPFALSALGRITEAEKG